MRRRSFLIGGAAAATGAGVVGYSLLPASIKMLAGNYRIFPGRIPLLVEHDFGWKGSDFLAGGTRQVDIAHLPALKFPDRPHCLTTLANIVGPCDAHIFPHRVDISEGRAGLPMRLSLRVLDAASCRPHAGAEVQIWHADARGIYSGRHVSAECTFNDPVATSGLAFRGRQFTDKDGVANFLTVYPGWYAGRNVHIHFRLMVAGRESLVSQIFCDDLLSDAIYRTHPDYRGRAERDTRNDTDLFSPRGHLNDYIPAFEKLPGGVLQATYVVGAAL